MSGFFLPQTDFGDARGGERSEQVFRDVARFGGVPWPRLVTEIAVGKTTSEWVAPLTVAGVDTVLG